MNKKKNLVILTGAGISKESGIMTFRDAKDGLWENHRVEDVASPDGFKKSPEIVHKFYNQRRAQLKEVEPNAAHYALAKLEEEWEGGFLIITQNVDDLHERAGSKNVCHMHGELKKVRCEKCNHIFEHTEDTTTDMACPECKEIGSVRPNVVWFGEMPLYLKDIEVVLENADLFASIGTSGAVYPAAMFVEYVHTNARDTKTIQVNPFPFHNSYFTDVMEDVATVAVPKLVEDLLSE